MTQLPLDLPPNQSDLFGYKPRKGTVLCAVCDKVVSVTDAVTTHTADYCSEEHANEHTLHLLRLMEGT